MAEVHNCPRCSSSDIALFKNKNGLKCNKCKLSLGPFNNPRSFEMAVKLHKKQRKEQ